MTTEIVTTRPELTAQQTIDRMREIAHEAETVYYVYVLDIDDKLVGILSLRGLIIALQDTKISEIMEKELITVDPQMPRRKVAQVISKYNLLAVPVVDEKNKLLGIVTVDDVIDFILPPISRRMRHMLG